MRTGRWSSDLGQAFSRLAARRLTGDYGGELHVSAEEAAEALDLAKAIVARAHEDLRS